MKLGTVKQFRDEMFDAVLCSHVLEHVDAPINLLREIRRILKKKGMLYLAVPTERSIYRTFKDDYFDDHPSHLYSFSNACLTRLLSYTGFFCERTYIDIPFLIKFRLKWLHDYLQIVPPWFARWLSLAFWRIERKQ